MIYQRSPWSFILSNLYAETSLAKGCLTTVITKAGGESAESNWPGKRGAITSGSLFKKAKMKKKPKLMKNFRSLSYR